MNSMKSVQWWIILHQLFDHKLNAVNIQKVAIRIFGRWVCHWWERKILITISYPIWTYFLFFFFCPKGICKFLKFGLGLETARNIIYNYNLIFRSPLQFIKRLNFNLILFLVGYVGIYRVIETHCQCSTVSFGSKIGKYFSINVLVRELLDQPA